MLDNEALEKVCRLAKVSISSSEHDNFLVKLNLVFGWIEQLLEIDTSEVDINDPSDMCDTPERADIPSIDNTKEEILSNTEFKKFDMFCVPKIVE